MTSFETQRRQMVRHQIEARGIRDRKVLDAIVVAAAGPGRDP